MTGSDWSERPPSRRVGRPTLGALWRPLRLMSAATIETARARSKNGPLRPGWTFAFETVVRFLRRDWVEMASWPPEALRSELEGRPYPDAMTKQCAKSEATLGGVRGTWFEPPAAKERAALVYAHGGSFIAGSARTHGDSIARFALATRLRTFVPEYRLAPEHSVEAAVEDVLAVFRALVASGVSPTRIATAGESAGGHLVVRLLLDLRDAGGPMPAATVAISGWFDLTGSMPSMEQHERYDYGTRPMLRAQAQLVAGGLPLDDPRLSLVNADLHGIGPLLVQAGTAEMLYDENVLLAERARAQGADVSFDPLPEMPHAATLLAAFTAEGRAAIDRAARFIEARIAE